jgi:AcrR family transcriptional regulator
MSNPAPDNSVDDAPPRRRRLPEERPRQIIDAAFAEFGEHGLEGARLDEIARRAGVSKGTIYLYFASKDELFRAVVRDKVVTVIEEAEANVERAANKDTPATTELRRYLTSHWDYVRSPMYQTMYRLTHTELPQFPDLARFYGAEVIDRALRLTASIVARGIARGEFRDIDPHRTARAISAICITHGVWFERRKLFQLENTDTSEEVRDFLIEFVLHSLRPDGGSSRAETHLSFPPALPNA